ncbi:Zinc finger, AN1-type [Cynara cardunculus var. scolymus]|uniref:Zinc finger, AN1-type n=1 Tax=Cynara cardunculus var. scolymus TaxID=59895 RepID=A0A103Y6L7_CYNCS|nr:Zinc finger, AN1-type [Cynara cardunculus var. scolymus]
MGTPAFPNLGKHCSVDDCKIIDFLPFTCDCCNKVFCLDHRSYISHQCPKANKNNRTVVICPLCAKGVHLVLDQDPNITWESHVNTDCDPSNYEKVTKKKKCPVRGCRETLTFSNTIKCRDCTIEHCLKHRGGASRNGGGASGQVEQCPICYMKFSKAAALIDHVQKVHEKKGVMKVTIDVCPKCSKGFRDPMALVQHVEREHRGMSQA